MSLPPDLMMMMQAWRYMAGYQKLSQKHLLFIERSENIGWSDRGNLFAALASVLTIWYHQKVHGIDLEKLQFVGDSHKIETRGHVVILILNLRNWKKIYVFVSVVKSAGLLGCILNLGYSVLVGTPEESVAPFFKTSMSLDFLNTFP